MYQNIAVNRENAICQLLLFVKMLHRPTMPMAVTRNGRIDMTIAKSTGKNGAKKLPINSAAMPKIVNRPAIKKLSIFARIYISHPCGLCSELY